MLGYTPEELQGKEASGLAPVSDLPGLGGHLDAFWKNPVGQPIGEGPELHLVRKDGSSIRVRVGMSPVQVGGSPLALLAMVEGRAPAADVVQEHRRVVTGVLDNLPGMAYCSFNDRDRTLQFVSEGSYELTGYRPEDLIGNRKVSYASLILPEDKEALAREIEASTVRGERFDVTYRIRTASGEVKWVSERGRARLSEGGSAAVYEGFIHDVTKRVRAEQESNDSERTLRSIIDHTFEYIGLLDNEGRLVRANETSLKDVGLSFEEVKGRLFWETPWWNHSAEEQAKLRGAVARAARGEFVRFETTHLSRDGRRIDVDFSLRPLKDENGRVVGMIPEGRDMSDYKKLENALRESEEKFFKVFRSSPDAISVSDLATGRFIEINEGFEKLSGYKRTEIIGRTSLELGIWSSPADRDRVLSELRTHGHVREMEIVARSRSGELRPFTLSAELVDIGGAQSVVMVSRDTTERLKAERALRESEEKFSKAFRSSPFSLTISELSTGRYVEVNEGFERVSGYSRDEVIGKRSSDIGIWMSSADREDLVARVRRDGYFRNVQVGFRRRDGTEVSTLCNGELLELGGSQFLLTAIEDITDRLQAERDKEQLEIQLRQSQKLEALGTLAGGIAHDFNNILAGIVILRELAMMDLNKPEEVRKHLTEMKQATTRAKDLVRQILTFSRKQKQERRPVRLHGVVSEALRLTRSSLPATIEIDLEIDERAPEVLADTGQVHQVVMNLATNAAHAMRGGKGRLTVRLSTEVVDEAFCRTRPSLRPGTFARLTVSDTGHGMDEATVSRIFEPFFTTKGPGEGTGLGLSVVRGIMEDHDGAILVASRPGEGTTFDLFFPQSAGETQRQEAPAAGAPPGGGESLLLVDDEPALCRAVGAMLRRWGYKVTALTDPTDAVAQFAAAPSGFDLVLADNMMPKMSGFDLIREIHGVRPGVPAILVSGVNTNLTAEALRSFGIMQHVPKPVDANNLAQAVRSALDARLEGKKENSR